MIEVLFQIPNPFITPTPDPATLAGGGGGNSGTLIGLAGVVIGGVMAFAPILKSWVDNKGNMAVQTTQVALNSHTAMLTSALQRADRLETELNELRLLFTDLKSEFASVKMQLADKTNELSSVMKERDDLKHRNSQLEQENDDLKMKVALLEKG